MQGSHEDDEAIGMISAMEFYGLKAEGHTTLEGVTVLTGPLQSESCDGSSAGSGSGSGMVHEGLSRGEPTPGSTRDPQMINEQAESGHLLIKRALEQSALTESHPLPFMLTVIQAVKELDAINARLEAFFQRHPAPAADMTGRQQVCIVVSMCEWCECGSI